MNVRAVIAAIVLAGLALMVTVWVRGSIPANSGDPSAPGTSESDSPPVIEVDKEAPFPKAVIDETAHEFGEMELGATGSHTFVIRNDGEDVLKLVKGKSTCKCTLSELANDEIPPGESAEISLEWEPKSASPEFGQQAQIHTNDPENKLITLEIKGKVFDTIGISPQGDLNIGNIQEETGAVTTLVYFSQLLSELDPPTVEYEGDKLEFQIKKVDSTDLIEHDAKCGYQIEIRAKPDVPVGQLRDSFHLVYQLKGEEVRERKSVTGQRRGPIRFLNTAGTTFYNEIALVDFGRFSAKEGKKQEVTLIIENPKNADSVKITEMTSDSDVLKVSFEPHQTMKLKNRSAFRLFFEVPPGSPPIDLARKTAPEILVKTDHPLVPEVVLHAEIHCR